MGLYAEACKDDSCEFGFITLDAWLKFFKASLLFYTGTKDFITLVHRLTLILLGPHHITGNGVGFKPDILDMDVMEKVLEVLLPF